MLLEASEDGLRQEGGSCETLARKLASNSPPAAAESSGLMSAAAVNATHALIVAAGMRCSLRVHATATKLVTTATSFANNEAISADRLFAIVAPTAS
ncbi:MAG: hypothetical protein WBD85_17205 [Mycobacterium sp.]